MCLCVRSVCQIQLCANFLLLKKQMNKELEEKKGTTDNAEDNLDHYL